MVGHTGDFKAAIKACESVDHYLGQIIKIANEKILEDNASMITIVPPKRIMESRVMIPIICCVAFSPNNATAIGNTNNM